MNRNQHRLIFNMERGIWMVVAEFVRARRKGRGGSMRRIAAAALLATTALVVHARPGVATPAPSALPVPSTHAQRSFVFNGTGSMAVTGNSMVIDQATRTLGLNWDSFNIGSDASVRFNQPDATSRVLNRIWSNDPSVIMGKLTANGQVFLINQNGILFGNGAQVNVGGLVASALGVSSSLLENGLPRNAGESLKFSWEGDAAGFSAGFVAVDSGAVISATGSPVVLLAPKLTENNGVIRTGEDGQVILAAGGSVLLTAPADPNLRGLLVEAKGWQGTDAFGNQVKLEGTVTHKSDGSSNGDGSINGSLSAEKGVVTLAALAVNQQGIVKASKAINLNGEIMLVSGSQSTERLTITQPGKKAEIDWQSGFSVSQGQVVEFIQPDVGAVAYNFVHDPDRTAADGTPLDRADRSHIDGVLKANGQLFLINEKGIDFGAHADVTASNFVAAALGIDPGVVSSGLLSQTDVGRAAFALEFKDRTAAEGEDPLTGAMAQSLLGRFRDSAINVAAGASIRTADNGFAILAGGKVSQAGTITTPGGQTVLAGGARVYLKPPYGQSLRGFTAEVDPLYVMPFGSGSSKKIADAVVLSRGEDANKVTNTGTVSASFGNITLVGHEIGQAGKLMSSTSVTRNGSIRLIARDLVGGSLPRDIKDGQVQTTSASSEKESFVYGTRGGKLTFGAGSKTEVALDGSDGQTVTASQTVARSLIEATAATINVEGDVGGKPGAELSARGGTIQFQTAASFGDTNALAVDVIAPDQTPTPSHESSIYVGTGAHFDVAGATAKKSVADLFIEVELRGDEFAGNPVQRFGALRGEKVWVDIRDKVSIADLSGYFNKVGQTLEEKSASGGSIILRSTGSVIVKRDAVLDVSGGRIDYAAGEVKESKVFAARGGGYRLNDAPVDLPYLGFVTITRQELAYSEGKSAGSVELSGQSVAGDGTFVGKTTRGERQRTLGDPATDRYAMPNGAKLIVRDGGQHFVPASTSDADKASAYGQAQITFVNGEAASADGLVFGNAARPVVELSRSLVDAGFSRFDIRSDGRIDIPADITLNLGPGGEFVASGRQVHVAGDILAPGGSLNLSSRDLSQVASDAFPKVARYSTLTVDEGALLSTAGQWINDLLVTNPKEYSVKSMKGGSITLTSAYDLDIKAGSMLDVSGGARLYRKSGKDAIDAGSAGKITLKAGSFGPPGFADSSSAIFLNGQLAGFGFEKGGSLEISGTQVRLGVSPPLDWRDLSASKRIESGYFGAVIDDDLLNRGGFAQFKFIASGKLDVADDAILHPNVVSWSLAGVRDFQSKPSGTTIGDFAQTMRLGSELRSNPTSLSLQATDVHIGEGANLKVDPLGTIDLSAIGGQMTVFGTLEAPAGWINLKRSYPDSLVDYTRDQQSFSIYLGSSSRLLAAGTVKLDSATRAALDAGISAEELHKQGRYKGQVLAGGHVDIDAGLGYLIARPGALIDVSGASGTLDVASTGRGGAYQTKLIGSAGGRVSMSAREGAFVNASYRAKGAQGAPGGEFAFSLGYSPNSWTYNPNEPDKSYVAASRELSLHQTTTPDEDFWPGELEANEYLKGSVKLDPKKYNGKARLNLSALLETETEKGIFGGFGSWYLQSQGQLGFKGTIDASVANQLRLDAPVFAALTDQAPVTLNAAAIQIGNYGNQVSSSPATGTSTFKASARDLALVGTFGWGGFSSSSFNSSGELHFDSMAHTTKVKNAEGNEVDQYVFDGEMKGKGNVTFSAARLSPAAFSDFTVDFAGNQIDITRPANAASPGPLLAAGGRLEFKANVINQRGTIQAPLGEIVFSAQYDHDIVDADGKILIRGGSVTLEKDSITSVAAGSLLPLGQTEQSGRDWKFLASVLNPSDGTLKTYTNLMVAAPEKIVKVDAAHSTIDKGAIIDVSGGGEAVAWEFTPGPGGKTDILAQIAGKEPTTFAILPGWNGNFAPADSQNQTYYNVSNPKATGNSVTFDSIPSLKPGDQIALGANPSGFVGTFTLLPAKYALLPGAVLVTIKPTQAATSATALPQVDGSWLVAGSKLAASADGSYAAYSQIPATFELAPQSVVSQRAKYVATTATGRYFDSEGAQLPGDAGRLSVAGRSSLSFDPAVLGQGVGKIQNADGRTRSGRNFELDLAAPKIEVVKAGQAGSGAGWTSFTKDKLNAFEASSLLLGGVRTYDDTTASIQTIAADVRIATGGSDLARDALQAPEILLAARNIATIETGSLVAASGDAPARAYVIEGDGAFARIAGGAQADVSRTGTVTRKLGDFILQDGAAVSGHALIFDATAKNTLAGKVGFKNTGQSAADGGALSIGAKRINIVGDGSTPADGLLMDNGRIAGFGALDQLRLTSYTTLDLYGPAALGTESVKELVINAAGVAGHGAKNSIATISAKSVRFENTNPESAVFNAADPGSGNLQVTTETMTFGGNATEAMREAGKTGFAISGFGNVKIGAAREIRFVGTGVTQVDAGLTMDAGRVVAATGSNHAVSATGAGKVTGGGNAQSSAEIGGKLALHADSLEISGRILAQAGRIDLVATGAKGNASFKNGAVVSADGLEVAFADTKAYAPAGAVSIVSKHGDVDIESGARISVSSDVNGGDAGYLSLTAQEGKVGVAADTLFGSAVGDGRQGELKVDAKSVSLDELAAAVGTSSTETGKTSAQFESGWDIRQREGDLALAKKVKAQRFRIAADKGDINVNKDGTIDASGPKGGTIELYANRAGGAGGHVNLFAGSLLKANATQVVGSGEGTAGRGGTVIVGVSATDAADELNTGIKFEAKPNKETAGGIIDVSKAEGSQAQDGKVIFRAPRQDTVGDLKSLQDGKIDWTNLFASDANGNGTAYTLADPSLATEYQKGMVAAFKVPAANTAGALTLNINKKGIKSVLRADGSPLAAYDIPKDSIVVAVYDGEAFRVHSLGAADTGSANNYKITPVLRPLKGSTFEAGYTVTFRAKSASANDASGNAKLQVVTAYNTADTVEAKLKRQDGSNLKANDIKANQLVTAVYTITATGAGEFRLLNDTALAAGPVTGSAMATVVLAGQVSGAASVALEGVRTTRVTGDYVLGNPQQSVLLAGTAQAAALKGKDFVAAADSSKKLGLVFRPGEEVRATTGSITVGNDWGFSNARYSGQAGVLTLRAAGDLNINGSLSDGFVMNGSPSSSSAIADIYRDARLASGAESWTYRLIAGADASQASPLATSMGTAGDITVATDKLVRTGKGSIDFAAAGDIVLKDRAAVYTAGVADTEHPTGFSPINNTGSDTKVIYSAFPTAGGDIGMTAGGGVVLEKNDKAVYQGHVNEWLMRAGGDTRNLQWWSRIASFQQGIAAFGGGDINLSAGADVRNAIVAIPTSGRVPRVDGVDQPDQAVISGGGDMTVRAGSITGGMFYVETGKLWLDAGEIKPYVSNPGTASEKTYNTSIAMGNSAVRVFADGDVRLGNVFNPLWTKGNYIYNDRYSTGAAAKAELTTTADYLTRVGTYGSGSALNLASLTGHIALAATDDSYGISDSQAHRVMPSRVRVAALNGDISGGLIQAPGSAGQLDLLAAGSIALNAEGIEQLDLPVNALPSVRNPMADTNFELISLNDANKAPTFRHATLPWHANDYEPSRVVALAGSITGVKGSDSYSTFNEAVRIEAGRNIENLSMVIQHVHGNDTSSVIAGGDIRFENNGENTVLPDGSIKSYTSAYSKGIQVGGPGRLEVLATNIDLGNSGGIVSRGNLDNYFLPEGGADLFLLAGGKPDYDGFRQYLGVGPEVSEAALRDRFFLLLREKGREALAGGGESSYEVGRDAVRALFPSAVANSGNIDLAYSQVKTEQGGDMEFLVPYGGITVGIATPASQLVKKPADQGIFTVRGGDINAFVRQDFLVNQSRVFTLDGGDIMVWADRGSIDAGSGAKTVSATPPPTLVVRDGKVVLDTSNSVAGSGIGVLASQPDTPASDLDLFAPQGAIDAGDAGLRSTGNVNLGAKVILNASNIQASGTVTGAPNVAAPAPVATAPASPANTQAADEQTAATAAAANKESRQGILTVEVLGMGEQGTLGSGEEKKECPSSEAGCKK